MLNVTDVLKALVAAIPIELAEVMDYARTGPYALKEDPQIWAEFRQIFKSAKLELELKKLERFSFYDAAGTPDVCLTVATGEQRIYANLLLTIGVVK
jgi:L-fucose mutarotase